MTSRQLAAVQTVQDAITAAHKAGLVVVGDGESVNEAANIVRQLNAEGGLTHIAEQP